MVNYGNSMIYKLCCKDASITDEYIGSTTNKSRRKQEHNTCCNNINSKSYNYKVYQFIREHGGFGNWDLIILEEYSCENKRQLEMKEREWIEKRMPTLNCNIPSRTEEEKKEIKKEFNEKNNKSEIYKEYRKQYEQTDKRKEYKKSIKVKNLRKKQYQQKKIKNKSAIIIQQFFKKYFQK